MSTPPVLLYDLETRPAEAVAFNVWQVNLSEQQLTSPVSVISASWKWLGDKRTHVMDVKTEGAEAMLTGLELAMYDAAAVVTFNGIKFDRRHLNRELILADALSLPQIAQIDLLKVVKDQFDFPFYRLDYVSERLLGERKLETGGIGLWRAYMAGDPKAIKLMREYNKHDVGLTERLYLKLRPWIVNHPNVAPLPKGLEFPEPTHACPTCGTDGLFDLGFPRRTRHFAIQRLWCPTCHAYSDGARKKI